MEETVFALLYRRINEKREPLQDHLVQGGAKSYEDYVRVSAQVTTLNSMEDDIKDLENRFIEQ
jgi:hypothetical protein